MLRLGAAARLFVVLLDLDAKRLSVYRIENAVHKLVAECTGMQLHADGMHWGAEILMDESDHVQIHSSPFLRRRLPPPAAVSSRIEAKRFS